MAGKGFFLNTCFYLTVLNFIPRRSKCTLGYRRILTTYGDSGVMVQIVGRVPVLRDGIFRASSCTCGLYSLIMQLYLSWDALLITIYQNITSKSDS